MLLVDYLLTHNRYLNLLGICVILFIAVIFSQKRSKISVKLIVTGLLLQTLISFLVLRTGIGQRVIHVIAFHVGKLYQFADAGIGFIFGNLANNNDMWGFIFGFQVLPVIIFFGAFMSLLFYFGIVQRLVGLINWLIRPLLGTSGAETLCAISNSFLGQTEAPLLVRHYLKSMTKSELLVVMISGMATISGAILVVFAKMGVPIEHMLTASVMAIPGSIVIAKILLPETEQTITYADAKVALDTQSHNVFDAIATGTLDGLKLALNVGAMLISFIALLAMINYILAYGAYKLNFFLYWFDCSWRLPTLSIERILSFLFAPFGYLLGFTGTQALDAAQLIGTKIAVNEVVAYSQMVKMNLPQRAVNILTYALCGFSNISCIGIQIGGIGALVPEKRRWLTQLGLYAVLGGSLANLLSAMIVALLL